MVIDMSHSSHFHQNAGREKCIYTIMQSLKSEKTFPFVYFTEKSPYF